MTPGSGREGRIYAQYRAMRKRWDYRRSGSSEIRMIICRQWEIPMRELRRILGCPAGACWHRHPWLTDSRGGVIDVRAEGCDRCDCGHVRNLSDWEDRE